ncbi:hypothetical protein B296_00040956, partial [Ensete ventricosum]
MCKLKFCCSATSVGAVSYMDIDGCRYKRDVLFCYDLKLPAEFTPKNEGEKGEMNEEKGTMSSRLLARGEGRTRQRLVSSHGVKGERGDASSP